MESILILLQKSKSKVYEHDYYKIVTILIFWIERDSKRAENYDTCQYLL